jgi:protein-disulfide isomerase
MEKFVSFLKNPIFITAVIIIAGIGGLLGLIKLFPDTQTTSVPYVEKYWGKADSTVTVTEYADFQCPGCGTFYSTVEQQLKSEYSGKIKYVYKYFPLTSLHRNAQKAAEASAAAGAQGKFWEYHDILYSRQVAESANWNTEAYVAYAKELGLDTARFQKELGDNLYRQTVKDGINEAQGKGYSGTPTIEVNGKKFEGTAGSVPSFEDLKAEIDKLLAAAPSATPSATVEPTK